MLDAAKNKHRAPVTPLSARTLCLTTFGLGFLRPAPGTWGSIPPPLLAAILVLLHANPAWHYALMGIIFLFFSAVTVWFGRYAEGRFGRKDAAEVVSDETAAVALALAGANPAVWNAESAAPILVYIALCFFGFRAFDIVKPWPARSLERLPRGWGVLVDDLVAGVYTAIGAQIVVGVAF